MVHGNIYPIMWLNAPANHGLTRTGKPPQLVNMFPHYLAMSEIPKESTHHLNNAESLGKQEAIYILFWG